MARHRATKSRVSHIRFIDGRQVRMLAPARFNLQKCCGSTAPDHWNDCPVAHPTPKET